MLDGFLLGLAIWVGPALLAWIIVGPMRLGRRMHHH